VQRFRLTTRVMSEIPDKMSSHVTVRSTLAASNCLRPRFLSSSRRYASSLLSFSFAVPSILLFSTSANLNNKLGKCLFTSTAASALQNNATHSAVLHPSCSLCYAHRHAAPILFGVPNSAFTSSVCMLQVSPVGPGSQSNGILFARRYFASTRSTISHVSSLQILD
jgi:hypothetical protein